MSTDDAPKSLEERLTVLATGWTAALAAVTALLYVSGYLALRFQLDALGIAATELYAVDERYLFEGALFLFYLLKSLPSFLLVALVAWAAGRLVPRFSPAKVRTFFSACSEPRGLVLQGIVCAVVAIQFVMCQVFYVRDLLLGPAACEPRWLAAVLHDTTGGYLLPVYFLVLLALVVPPVLCLRAAWRGRSEPRMRLAVAVLAVLVTVQLLLLPVNYGVLTAGERVPRLKVPKEEPDVSRLWRVWEGKTRTIFLVEKDGEPPVRQLVVVPSANVERLDVLWHEDLLKALHGDAPCGGSPP